MKVTHIPEVQNLETARLAGPSQSEQAFLKVCCHVPPPMMEQKQEGKYIITAMASSIQVRPDQQQVRVGCLVSQREKTLLDLFFVQVFYTVIGEDRKGKRYMMLCPRVMDHKMLIQTLVRQVTSNSLSRGKETIYITEIKNGVC